MRSCERLLKGATPNASMQAKQRARANTSQLNSIVHCAPVVAPCHCWCLAAAAAIVVSVAIAHAQQQNFSSTSTARPNYLETGRQITGILDRFMSLGYDKRVRPNYGGPPVEVNVTMRILSISSVSEVMMDFTADFYFRQTWHDPRLSFKKLGDIQTLYVGAEVSKKIWLPDTFFGNEKMAYFHEATTPNVFLRIDHSGEVYRSIRLTVTSSCPMNLQYFPMDRQRCTIEAESYGYNVKDIIYRWARKDTAVERDKEISLPQFDIVQTVQKYRLEELSSGTYSRLIAEIHFARRMGYYLIQIYIPSSLIVVISWVSFWLHRNASPARVQLGVTTVLTMTTLMSSTNAALPKISYVKSIDIFLGTCFVMVFAALLEYATVGYLGKRIAMRKAQAQHAQSQAQARLLALLQAQGAQGDPVPPTATSALVRPQGATDGAAQAQPSSPLSLIGAGFSATDRQQQQQQHQLTWAAEQAPEVPERTHCAQCHHHYHHFGHQQQQQQQQHDECNTKCAHHRTTAGAANRCVCGHAKASRTGAAQLHSGACEQTSNSLSRRRDIASCNKNCFGSATNHDQTRQNAPRNITFANDQQHQCPTPSSETPHHHQHQNETNNCLQATAAAAANMPPAYRAGPSQTAAAAAAQFINLHRRNKGLPPSTNPNFAQFNPSQSPFVAPTYNRALETIFGIRPSDIDKYSRVVFPVCFVCFQLMYWIVYLHISAFLETDKQDAAKTGQLVPPSPPSSTTAMPPIT